jgi:hypothetical protein
MAHDQQVAHELGEATRSYRSAISRLRKSARKVDREIREIMADSSLTFEERRARAEQVRAEHADEISKLARRVESRRERSLEAVRRLHSSRITEDEARAIAHSLLQRGHKTRAIISQAQALGDYPTLEALVKLVRYTGDPSSTGDSEFIDAEAAEEAIARIEAAMLAVAPEDEAEALEAAGWVRSAAVDEETEITLNYARGVAQGDGGPGERMMLGLVRGEAAASDEWDCPVMAARSKNATDLLVIGALAAGATYEDAAQAAGISERTVRRRMADPDFRARLWETRGRYLDRALGRLSEISVEAVDALAGLLSSDSERVRLRAAVVVLDHGRKLREAGEIEERLVVLEESVREIRRLRPA